MQDTYEDPQKAYEEAKRTLAYVSAKLNEGTSELEACSTGEQGCLGSAEIAIEDQ
jgi:hypothetical protein